MKNNKIIFLLILSILLLTGCENVSENSAPVIEGVNAIECMVNTTIDLLNGVVAYDKEEGDITPLMDISINPTVKISNGYAIFDEAGSYKLTYSVKDNAGIITTKQTDINVYDRETYLDFSSCNGFYTKVSGQAVLEKGGIYNGEYLISAKKCEVFEDVSLNRVYEIEKNSMYTFDYSLESSASGMVRILADGLIIDEKNIESGENNIKFNYPSTTKSSVTISLLLGGLDEKIDCNFKGVTYTYTQEEGWREVLTSFSVEERFDSSFGIEGKGSKEDGVAILKITKAHETEQWAGGIFIKTNIPTEVGQEYIVSFTVEREKILETEVSFQNAKFDEKTYSTIFVNNEEKINHYECKIEVLDGQGGQLWLYLKSGKYVNEVKLSDLSVQRYFPKEETKTLGFSDFVNLNEGFDCGFETFPGGFRYTISEFSGKDYEQQVKSANFFVDGSGMNYVITFKAKASKPIEVIFAIPIADGWDPTWLWQRIHVTEEEQTYSFYGNDSGGGRENVLVWQFGAENNQKYKDVVIEISDIKISYKNNEHDGE